MKKYIKWFLIIFLIVICIFIFYKTDANKQEMLDNCVNKSNNREYCKCTIDGIEKLLGKRKSRELFLLNHQRLSGDEVSAKVSVSDMSIYDKIDELDTKCYNKYKSN